MSGSLVGFLLGLVPALVLLAFLLAGRYPGERLIEAVRRFLVPPHRSAAPAPGRCVSSCLRHPAGGALISHGMAGRAPPAIGPRGPIPIDQAPGAPGNEKKETKLKNIKRLATTAAAAACLALPAAASAHVTADPAEAPAEGYVILDVNVPHGCDGAATNSLTLQMPPQVTSATPGVVAGWDVSMKEGKLPKPVEMHGEKVTEGVRQVTWTGGPLPDGELQQFPISLGISGEEGETMYIKAIQGCVGGAETAWIQETPEGGPEPESPAPAVTLVAAEDDHGGSSDSHEGAATETTATEDDPDDGGSDGLSVLALVIGGIGLCLGAASLIRTRALAKGRG